MLKIFFKNIGQNLLWVVVDESGYITDCNTKKSSWLHCHVKCQKPDIKFLNPGEWVYISRDNDKVRYPYEVEKIEPVEAAG